MFLRVIQTYFENPWIAYLFLWTKWFASTAEDCSIWRKPIESIPMNCLPLLWNNWFTSAAEDCSAWKKHTKNKTHELVQPLCETSQLHQKLKIAVLGGKKGGEQLTPMNCLPILWNKSFASTAEDCSAIRKHVWNNKTHEELLTSLNMFSHLGQLTEWIASLMSVNKVGDHD